MENGFNDQDMGRENFLQTGHNSIVKQEISTKYCYL